MNDKQIIAFLVEFLKQGTFPAEVLLEENWYHANQLDSPNPNYCFKNLQLMVNYGTESSGWIAKVVVNKNNQQAVFAQLYNLNHGIELYQQMLDQSLPNLDQLKKR